MGGEGDGPRRRTDPRHGARDGDRPARRPRAPGPARQPGTATTRSAAARSRSFRAARQLGAKGGLYFAAGMKVAPTRCPSRIRNPGKPKADNPNGAQYPFADEGVTTGLREATLTGKPYPIKGWFVYSTNLMQALPNAAETLKAIDKLDLLVVCDTIPSEIAGYADVVLPETIFLERHDELLVGFGRLGWTALRAARDRRAARAEARLVDRQGTRRASSASPTACRSRTWRSTSRSASRSPASSWDDAEEGRRDHGHAEADHRRGRRSSSSSTRRRRRSSSGPTSSPRPASTRCRSTRRPRRRRRAIFRLITGRAPVHTFSRTQNNPLLHDLMRENEVWVNAATAAKAGLEERPVREAQEPGRRRRATASRSRPRSASAPTASTWSTASATPARC